MDKKSLVIGLVAGGAAYLLYQKLKSRGALGRPPHPPHPPGPPPGPPPPPAPTWPSWYPPMYYPQAPIILQMPADLVPEPGDFWADGTVDASAARKRARAKAKAKKKRRKEQEDEE